MAVLLFVGGLYLWVVLCAWIAAHAGRVVPRPAWGQVLTILVFLGLASMPVIDEIVAAPQFARLCREQARLVLDDAAPRGKAVAFEGGTRHVVSIWPLEATVTRHAYVDAGSSSPAYHYHEARASGGLLVSTLGISPTSPLLFEGVCGPPELGDLEAWIKQAGMSEVPRRIGRSGR
jgi:hypothetical protein